MAVGEGIFWLLLFSTIIQIVKKNFWSMMLELILSHGGVILLRFELKREERLALFWNLMCSPLKTVQLR